MFGIFLKDGWFSFDAKGQNNGDGTPMKVGNTIHGVAGDMAVTGNLVAYAIGLWVVL